MLNLKVDVSIEKTKYPIHFEKVNECVHCGAKGSLIFIDKFGREARREVNAFSHIKCRKCNRIYSIFWQQDGNSKNMFPSAIGPNINQEFANFTGQKKIRENGVMMID